jgi:hypothetical protein
LLDFLEANFVLKLGLNCSTRVVYITPNAASNPHRSYMPSLAQYFCAIHCVALALAIPQELIMRRMRGIQQRAETPALSGRSYVVRLHFTLHISQKFNLIIFLFCCWGTYIDLRRPLRDDELRFECKLPGGLRKVSGCT